MRSRTDSLLLLPALLTGLAWYVPSAAGASASQGGASAPSCTFGWQPFLEGSAGATYGPVNAFVVGDVGAGTSMYAVGEFTDLAGAVAPQVARWDGQVWSPMGNVGGFPEAAAIFDDGNGPRLYVGMRQTSSGTVRQWNGSTWVGVGGGTKGDFQPPSTAAGVRAMTVFDDGNGPALYVGGWFHTAGTSPALNVARWDGSSWSALGAGIDGVVESLEVHDDGTGPALFAGGTFTSAGGVTANGVARWDGTAWSAVGAGFDGTVYALRSWNDGSTSRLCAGGEFAHADGAPASNLAQWDGTAWTAMGAGSLRSVHALAVHGAGGGAQLHAGGSFQPGGSARLQVGRWDGAAWTPVGTPIAANSYYQIRALAAFQGTLWAGGDFQVASGGVSDRITYFSEGKWHALGGAPNDVVRSLEPFHAGTKPVLFVGGSFSTIAGVKANGIAMWDGDTWTGFPGASSNVQVWDLEPFDDGSGLALYAGGSFSLLAGVPAGSVARWNGTNWSAVGGGLGTIAVTVRALAAFDDGSGEKLYAGGSFGPLGAINVWRWNGATWSPAGNAGGSGASVWTLEAFDAGSGAVLYAGTGSAPALSRWNGSSWSSVPGTTHSSVYTLLAHDDGSGPALFVGGLQPLRKWTGSAWHPVGAEGPPAVWTLHASDLEGSPALYAGGGFVAIAGTPVQRLARWDGANWTQVGSGVGGTLVDELEQFDDGTGPALYVGGLFANVIVDDDANLARWGCVSGFTPVPGCFGNPATLTPASSTLTLGAQVAFDLTSRHAVDGWSWLFAGVDGADASGCGLALAGLGELLLGAVPSPVLIDDAPLVAGQASFQWTVPAAPALQGLEVGFQAVDVALALPGSPVGMSNALRATVAP